MILFDGSEVEQVENESEEIEVKLCKSHSKVVNLMDIVKLEQDEKLDIGDDYKYSLNIDVCDNPGGECEVSPSKFAKTSCHQTYITMSVRILRKEKAEIKSVQIPSNCACRYRVFKKTLQ